MQRPETRYAWSGEVNIAYQVTGDAPFDLVVVAGWVSHLEYAWEDPSLARFLGRLASFSRLIRFDKRGTGLSDRIPLNQLSPLEQRVDLETLAPTMADDRRFQEWWSTYLRLGARPGGRWPSRG